MTSPSYSNIVSFVKYNRQNARLTQEELAERAGVGLRFIRDLEQGKETLRMDKVNQVLQLFGHHLRPGSDRRHDAYQILLNHFNRKVQVNLKNKNVLTGYLIEPLYEQNEIRAWKFVTIKNEPEHRKSQDPSLVEIINHADIEDVENI